MRARILPGGRIGGTATVPGDKSIAHRWLMLAATASGRSRLANLPPSLDVVSTARCLAAVTSRARPSLEGWVSKIARSGERHGFTWDVSPPDPSRSVVEVEGDGRTGPGRSAVELDCGNSGTTLRLLAGLLAPCPGPVLLTGDPSLLSRPMERVAEPLRRMGSDVRTTQGRPPVRVAGGPLRGIRFESSLPSAQVKSAVLLAGTAAEGETIVVEAVPTRDHTERALSALGAPISLERGQIAVSAFQHEGFEGSVPGDLSSAAFLLVAAALTGGDVTVHDVGVNPSRTRFLDVMRRMGVAVEVRPTGERVGEPLGAVRARVGGSLVGTTVEAEELPLLIDEVPILVALAAHARGETWFVGAGELRVKESDRLNGLAALVRGLGGEASVEQEDLVVVGGGLAGGRARSGGDHRIAMAAAVAALAADGPCEIDGIEDAAVSFPGFAGALSALGASLEP